MAAAVLFAGIIISLPAIVKSQLKDRLPQIAAPHNIEFEIEKIGIARASLSNISINDQVTIDHADIVYNLKKLPTLEVRKVFISGVRLKAFVGDDRQIKIKGISLPKPGPEKKKTADPSVFSFLPDKIRIQNSRLILDAFSEQFYLPFDLMAIVNKKEKQVDVQAGIHPFGEKINLLCAWQMQKGITHIRLDTKGFDLDHLNAVLTKNKHLFKDVTFHGPCDVSLETFSPGTNWSVSISSLGLHSPFGIQLTDVKAVVQKKRQGIFTDTSFAVSHSRFSPIAFHGAVSIDNNSDMPYQLRLESQALSKWDVAAGSIAAGFTEPRIKITMDADSLKGSGTVSFETRTVDAAYKGQKVRTGRVICEPAFSLERDSKTLKGFIKPLIEMTNVRLDDKAVSLSLPALQAAGSIAYTSPKGPAGRIELKAADGRARIKDRDINISGIDFYLPFSYPSVKKGRLGSFNAHQIDISKKHLLSVQGQIIQQGLKRFNLDGMATSGQLDKVRPKFSLAIDLDKSPVAVLDFMVPAFKMTDQDIKQVFPKIPLTAGLSMTLAATGHARYDRSRLETGLQLEIKDGQVDMPDLNLVARGINSKVTINDLLKPESIPGQILTIDDIEVNKIRLKKAVARFSIEDAKYLLLENLAFQWCKGIVSTEAIRFPNKDSSYLFTLYCDRLDLAELMMQMGVFHAEGTGTLSGRIPIAYKNGEIAFKNGFLFSTPGSGGRVSVMNTEKLTAGIPINSAQFSQLDVAKEALKDFEYKWAKLKLNTLEDTLFVKMEMDGKPSHVLPFVYKKELGGFARVDASHPGSRFQGITLDVNLNLPFNDVLKFGKKMKKIFNQ